MKILIIVSAVVVGFGVLVFLLLRPQTQSTYKATAGEIPTIIEKLRLGHGNPRFAVLMFIPHDSKDGVPVNLQYSFENGAVGFDWVLLSPRNIADKDAIIEYAAKMGQTAIECEQNKVKYLRVESPLISDLGIKVIRDFYKIDPNIKLEMIVEGIEWQPVAP